MNKRYKKGFICGMFDLFHTGHFDILRTAKEMCEYVIVAVGTDEFYRVRKNREPMESHSKRVEHIKAIRYVDEVVEQTDLDKVAMYHKYHFDAMFSGEDHKFEDCYIHATKELKKMGVDTIYLSRCGITSTKLREFIY